MRRDGGVDRTEHHGRDPARYGLDRNVGRNGTEHWGNSTGAGQIFARLFCVGDPGSAAVSQMTTSQKEVGSSVDFFF